jgi:3-(3-hydroxy-phenyl)propionate hydroxylase
VEAETETRTQVVIVGAGPVGLMTANFLGTYGIDVLVIEQSESIIDYPRGVGMDDECLRAYQAVGLAQDVLPHTTPNQWLRFVTRTGRCFASVEPRTDEFGWPRRNAFIQPLADQVLFDGTRRFPNVSIRFGHLLESFEETGDGVRVIATAGGRRIAFEASLLVGCDGGRSTVRKLLGIDFDGKTDSTQWLVVDMTEDPIGTPNAYLHCDPARPYVSICLPHGIRRLEFMLMRGETEEEIVRPERFNALLAKVLAHPEQAKIMRRRVYTHHARLASTFRKGRVLLGGDAAHLMPVWQGQGYNSGIRDAFNMSWKIAAVLKGQAEPTLLDTYDRERRPHARSMIDISTLAGKIFSPTNRVAAKMRDVGLSALNAWPPAKRYIMQMRFKPMPTYDAGAVVPATGKESPIGRMFIQPRVLTVGGRECLLDDAIGPWFALLSWGVDPNLVIDEEARRIWQRLGAQSFVVRPPAELRHACGDMQGTLALGDVSGRLKNWFDSSTGSIVVLRPDRFVAAIASPQSLAGITRAFAAAASLTRDGARMQPRVGAVA